MQAFHGSCNRLNPCGPGCAAEWTNCDDEECTGNSILKLKIPSGMEVALPYKVLPLLTTVFTVNTIYTVFIGFADYAVSPA